MSGRRAPLRALWRRRRHRGDASVVPPKPWGRIGAYEAVTRQDMLFLLAPEPSHPSRRATSSA